LNMTAPGSGKGGNSYFLGQTKRYCGRKVVKSSKAEEKAYEFGKEPVRSDLYEEKGRTSSGAKKRVHIKKGVLKEKRRAVSVDVSEEGQRGGAKSQGIWRDKRCQECAYTKI